MINLPRRDDGSPPGSAHSVPTQSINYGPLRRISSCDHLPLHQQHFIAFTERDSAAKLQLQSTQQAQHVNRQACTRRRVHAYYSLSDLHHVLFYYLLMHS